MAEQLATLPPSVENLINQIREKQSQPPLDPFPRRRLAEIGEQQALQLLGRISKSKIYNNLNAYIMYMLKQSPYSLSPSKSSPLSLSQPPPSTLPPSSSRVQTALRKLEFGKSFLQLKESVENVATGEYVRSVKDLPMQSVGKNYIHHDRQMELKQNIEDQLVDKAQVNEVTQRPDDHGIFPLLPPTKRKMKELELESTPKKQKVTNSLLKSFIDSGSKLATNSTILSLLNHHESSTLIQQGPTQQLEQITQPNLTLQLDSEHTSIPYPPFVKFIAKLGDKLSELHTLSTMSLCPNEVSRLWDECKLFTSKWIEENEVVARKSAKNNRIEYQRRMLAQEIWFHKHKEEQEAKNKWLIVALKERKKLLALKKVKWILEPQKITMPQEDNFVGTELVVSSNQNGFNQDCPPPQFVTREAFDKFLEQTKNFIDVTNKRHEDEVANMTGIRSTLDLILDKLYNLNS